MSNLRGHGGVEGFKASKVRPPPWVSGLKRGGKEKTKGKPRKFLVNPLVFARWGGGKNLYTKSRKERKR